MSSSIHFALTLEPGGSMCVPSGILALAALRDDYRLAAHAVISQPPADDILALAAVINSAGVNHVSTAGEETVEK